MYADDLNNIFQPAQPIRRKSRGAHSRDASDTDTGSEDRDPVANSQSSEVGYSTERLESLKDQQETPRKRRGRPKGSKNRRTPTPPPNLPAFEQYFFQNRPSGGKSSSNTLSSTLLLDHEEYFHKIKAQKDAHAEETRFLHELHERSFDQWLFELEEGFNICLYGWGSKRAVLEDFAIHLTATRPAFKTIIVNGFKSGFTIRNLLSCMASTIPRLKDQKVSASMTDAVATILDNLESAVILMVHSIDSISLRRPGAQAALAMLASSPHIHLIGSADTATFPLLWDSNLLQQFNFLFHDTTTFAPFDVEISSRAGGVVDEINALIGRSGRRIDGREGVMYVLQSLTENARNLFAISIAEVLSTGEVEGEMDDANDGDERDTRAGQVPSNKRMEGHVRAGIELRSLYQKAVSQLVVTTEHQFRNMLKEFFDHEMMTSCREGLGGTEVITLPFRREELEAILSELMV